MSSKEDKWINRYYVDFRFIVEVAENHGDAADKADALIKEATDNVWYTINKVVKQQRNLNNKHSMWHDYAVKIKPLLSRDDTWI